MRRELAAVAASNISAMGKRDAKRATLDRARDAVARSSPAVRGGRMNLERWLSTNLNAAHLYGVFDDDGYAALFERLLSSDSNADYRNFVVRVRSIAGLHRHEQRAVLSAAVAAIE
jgi:predicted aminopeptidase